MSPSPAAPSNASHTACSSTSASECPSRPFSNAMVTPPMISARPLTSACTSNPWPILISPPTSYVLQYQRGKCKMLRRRALEVACMGLHKLRFVPERLDCSRLIGCLRQVAGTQRAQQHLVAEHLRRLCLPESGAGLGTHRTPIAARALERIGNRDRQQSARTIFADFLDQPIQHLRTKTGARGIVHQNPVIGPGLTRYPLKGIEYRCGTRISTHVERLHFFCERLPVVSLQKAIVRREGRINAIDGGVHAQSCNGVIQQRPVADRKILFGRYSAHATAGAGGGNAGEIAGHESAKGSHYRRSLDPPRPPPH